MLYIFQLFDNVDDKFYIVDNLLFVEIISFLF